MTTRGVMIAITVAIVEVLFILGLSYMPQQKYGERCRIVGDHEIVANHCIPYCPPHPSECG